MTVTDMMGGVPVVVGSAVLVPFLIWAFIYYVGDFENERDRTGWLLSGLFAASTLVMWLMFGR